MPLSVILFLCLGQLAGRSHTLSLSSQQDKKRTVPPSWPRNRVATPWGESGKPRDVTHRSVTWRLWRAVEPSSCFPAFWYLGLTESVPVLGDFTLKFVTLRKPWRVGSGASLGNRCSWSRTKFEFSAPNGHVCLKLRFWGQRQADRSRELTGLST